MPWLSISVATTLEAGKEGGTEPDEQLMMEATQVLRPYLQQSAESSLKRTCWSIGALANHFNAGEIRRREIATAKRNVKV